MFHPTLYTYFFIIVSICAYVCLDSERVQTRWRFLVDDHNTKIAKLRECHFFFFYVLSIEVLLNWKMSKNQQLHKGCFFARMAKNPAHGRHSTSWPMRIVSSLPWREEKNSGVIRKKRVMVQNIFRGGPQFS